ncbi:hypothetical protein N431DRAFT_467510 [Stipitochalara longipes BDJ]|nr:hypothetical protein N431DRAFT_467510 [Stipitochalara longipes BDJ]
MSDEASNQVRIPQNPVRIFTTWLTWFKFNHHENRSQHGSNQTQNKQDESPYHHNPGISTSYNEALEYSQRASSSARDDSGDTAQPSSNNTSKTSSGSFTPYHITYRGTNSQGNRYDNRVQHDGPGYHYSNKGKISCIPGGSLTDLTLDGSYYYKNGDNSTYYNDGYGGSRYTAPDGNVYKK